MTILAGTISVAVDSLGIGTIPPFAVRVVDHCVAKLSIMTWRTKFTGAEYSRARGTTGWNEIPVWKDNIRKWTCGKSFHSQELKREDSRLIEKWIAIVIQYHVVRFVAEVTRDTFPSWVALRKEKRV